MSVSGEKRVRPMVGSVERKRDTVQVLDSRRKCEGIFCGDSNVLL